MILQVHTDILLNATVSSKPEEWVSSIATLLEKATKHYSASKMCAVLVSHPVLVLFNSKERTIFLLRLVLNVSIIQKLHCIHIDNKLPKVFFIKWLIAIKLQIFSLKSSTKYLLSQRTIHTSGNIDTPQHTCT